MDCRLSAAGKAKKNIVFENLKIILIKYYLHSILRPRRKKYLTYILKMIAPSPITLHPVAYCWRTG